MFVLEALLLTFMTTPLVSTLYPLERRVRVAATGANFNSVADGEVEPSCPSRGQVDSYWRSRFTVVLDNIDHVPGMMALTQLLQPRAREDSRSVAGSSVSKANPTELTIDALRLIELSDRTSAVMKSSAADTLIHTDPLLRIFRMFGELNDLPVSTSLSIVAFDELAHSVVDHAHNKQSQLMFLPWLSPTDPTTEPKGNDGSTAPKAIAHSHNPFDALFKSSVSNKSDPALHSQFVRGVFQFSMSKTDVALFIDQGHVPGAISTQHIFLPFFGGPDDRRALEFVVQLCTNPNISATVVRVEKRDVEVDDVEPLQPAHLGNEKATADEETERIQQLFTATSQIAGFPDTVYGHVTTQMLMESETADNLTWDSFALRSPAGKDDPITPLTAPLSRIEFSHLATPRPLHAIIQQTFEHAESRNIARLLTVVGRSRRLAVQDHRSELVEVVDEHGSVGNEVRATVGDVATALLVAGRGAGIIVMQAAM
jgi:hypothetical protein